MNGRGVIPGLIAFASAELSFLTLVLPWPLRAKMVDGLAKILDFLTARFDFLSRFIMEKTEDRRKAAPGSK